MDNPDSSDVWQNYISDLSPDGSLLNHHSFSHSFQGISPTLPIESILSTRQIFPEEEDLTQYISPETLQRPTQKGGKGRGRRNSGSKEPQTLGIAPDNSQRSHGGMDASSAMMMHQFMPNIQTMPMAAFRPTVSRIRGDEEILHSDSPSASSLSQTPRREGHMASEQRRRAVMRNCFERLQQLLPSNEYRKPSKANLLASTVNYLEKLQLRERQLSMKIQKLHFENMVMLRQLQGQDTTLSAASLSQEAQQQQQQQQMQLQQMQQQNMHHLPIAPAGHQK